MANDYGIMAFPTHIIIDKNATVAFSATGLGPTTLSDIDKLIETMVK